MSLPVIVPFEKIEQLTSNDTFDCNLIEAIAKGFRDLSENKFNLCPIQTLGAPPMAPLAVETLDDSYAAQVCIKSGYITGDAHFVIKIAAGGNPINNTGLMQVFSQSTGELQALLLDQGILTELRTAAAGAVAVKFLGPTVVRAIGMLGTGVQARYQMRYMKRVTDCRVVMVWGRTRDNVESFKVDLMKQGWLVEVVDSADQLMTCDLLITTTCARNAILKGPGTSSTPSLIVCIGADSVGKQEVSADLVTAADCLVCDSKHQTGERGEFQHAIRAGKVDLSNNVLEIGQIVADPSLIASKRSLTIFDTSGVAIQDCVVAKMVYESLMGQS
jgi:ornithine cyclodeaminase